LKELEPKKEQTLPPNVTIAWGRSTVSFAEITYRTPNGHNVRLHRIERSLDRQFTDTEWMNLLGDVIFQAYEHPENQYHFVRLDHERFVPENSNNEPYREANNWSKHMNMFGFGYDSKL